MSEVMKVIKERRSIRKFKPDTVPKDAINEIIEAGLYAASGMEKQPLTQCPTSRTFIMKRQDIK